jgi:hypothetical protein
MLNLDRLTLLAKYIGSYYGLCTHRLNTSVPVALEYPFVHVLILRFLRTLVQPATIFNLFSIHVTLFTYSQHPVAMGKFARQTCQSTCSTIWQVF